MDYEPLPAMAALSLVSALSSCRQANKRLHSGPPRPVPGRTSGALLAAGGTTSSWRYVLHSELVRSHGDAVDELHGAPEAMEFHALVHVHHPVAGQGPAPDGIVQEGADARQDNLKHGQAAAEAFFGQQVPFPCDCYLLEGGEKKVQNPGKSHLTARLYLKKKPKNQNQNQKTNMFFSFTWFILGEIPPDFKWGQRPLTCGSVQWKKHSEKTMKAFSSRQAWN